MTDSLRKRTSSATPGRPVLRGFRLFVTCATGLVCAGGAAAALGSGQGVLAILLACATLLAFTVFGQVLFLKRFVPRATADHTGTTLRSPRAYDLLSLTTSVGAILLFVPWAVLGTLHMVSVPFPDKLRHGYLLIFGWAAVFCAVVVVKYVQNGGMGYLRFTSDEFVFAEVFWKTKGAWADVIAITDDAPVRGHGIGRLKIQQSEAYALCAITMVMANGAKAAIGNGTQYSEDGDALREWIRFYWDNPAYRAEFTDGRALERLRTWRTSPG